MAKKCRKMTCRRLAVVVTIMSATLSPGYSSSETPSAQAKSSVCEKLYYMYGNDPPIGKCKPDIMMLLACNTSDGGALNLYLRERDLEPIRSRDLPYFLDRILPSGRSVVSVLHGAKTAYFGSSHETQSITQWRNSSGFVRLYIFRSFDSDAPPPDVPYRDLPKYIDDLPYIVHDHAAIRFGTTTQTSDIFCKTSTLWLPRPKWVQKGKALNFGTQIVRHLDQFGLSNTFDFDLDSDANRLSYPERW